MNVYLVKARCGDYYCGSCGHYGHILAVCTDYDIAKEIEDKASKEEWDSGGRKWESVVVATEPDNVRIEW